MIVAGFGFRGSASVESLVDAYNTADAPKIAALATAQDKATSPVFQSFAAQLDLPVIAIDTTELAQQVTMTKSEASCTARGVGSVCEAAALAGAGVGAELLGPRVISQDRQATCALARRIETTGDET